jgi:hypothetical protein
MILAVLFSLAIAGQAPAIPRDCRDDNGTDRCQAENRAVVLQALGMRSAEDELAAGTEVYRALQIDGYGRTMAGVAFERAVGSSPRVVVYGEGGNRMSAPVALADWRAVQDEAALATRDLTPEARDDEVILCLHGWVSTIEIANAAERGAPKPEVRRRTQSACDHGLASRFAFSLVARAIKAFPDCDALDPKEHRNDAARLKTCVAFRGDRLAAAELMNQTGQRAVPEDNADTALAWMRGWGGAGQVKLDWAGRRIVGDGFRANAVATFMIQQMVERPGLRGYIMTFNGVSSTRVETTGVMEAEGPNDSTLSAPFRQVWLWDSAGLTWKLDSWAVEPFAPAP